MTKKTVFAGTIDMLAYNLKKGCYSIIDWKTSKKFDQGNSFTPYMKPPFEHVLSCNTNEYSLQLSLYKYILEKKQKYRNEPD